VSANTQTNLDYLKSIIRDVPDFPIPGILFRDITPLLGDGKGFGIAIDALTEPFRDQPIDLIAAVEARGYLLASPMSYNLGRGLVPVRKPGKLPANVVKQEYALEYGTNTLEMHHDAIKPGQRVLIVDDVIATGGSAKATADLVEKLGGVVAGFAFLIELEFLKGREVLGSYPVHSVLKY
jgi:adenine phosphoribosyltransferase